MGTYNDSSGITENIIYIFCVDMDSRKYVLKA